MRRRPGRRGAALAALCVLSVLAPPAFPADPVAAFYARRTVSLVVADDAGDAAVAAALLARHLRPHIPGRPPVVVQHMPGAGGARGANFVHGAAPRDGTVLLMPAPNGPLVQRLLPPARAGFRFDHAEFSWLGRLATAEAVLMAQAASGMREPAHLREGRGIACAMARLDPSALMPHAVAEATGAPVKIVRGYPGAKAMLVAFAARECNLLSLPWAWWKAGAAALLADGTAVPLAVMAAERSPSLPRVAAAVELAPAGTDRLAMALLVSPAAIGRAVALAPGVPAERREALQAALAAALADPAFADEARRQQIDLAPADGPALRRHVADVLDAPERIVARARALAGL